jgi:hypothetical protein
MTGKAREKTRVKRKEGSEAREGPSAESVEEPGCDEKDGKWSNRDH